MRTHRTLTTLTVGAAALALALAGCTGGAESTAPSPSPTATVTVTATPEPSPSEEPTATAAPTVEPVPAPETSEAPAPEPTPEPTAEVPTPKPTAAPEPTSEPTATPEAVPTQPAQGAPGGINLCTAAMLSGTVDTAPDAGAAGSVYSYLTVTNTSPDSCQLFGYPGVSYVGGNDGTQLGAAAIRDAANPGVAIELQPGDSAQAVLRESHAENYGAQCEGAPADGLRVYPPSARDALFVPHAKAVCTDQSISLLGIGAFQPVE